MPPTTMLTVQLDAQLTQLAEGVGCTPVGADLLSNSFKTASLP
jgi:hypothetical protein